MTLPRMKHKFPPRGMHLQIEAPKSEKDAPAVWLRLTDHEALDVIEVAAYSKPREGTPAFTVSIWGGRRLDGYWDVTKTAAKTIRALMKRRKKGAA